MKKKTLQTGVRRLDITELWYQVGFWLAADKGRTLNSIQTLTAQAGHAVHATTLHKVRDKKIRTINAESIHALCLVLGVTWENVSESLD